MPGKDNAEYLDTSASIGGRLLCSLRFADHINPLVGSEKELQKLTEILEKTSEATE